MSDDYALDAYNFKMPLYWRLHQRSLVMWPMSVLMICAHHDLLPSFLVLILNHANTALIQQAESWRIGEVSCGDASASPGTNHYI